MEAAQAAGLQGVLLFKKGVPRAIATSQPRGTASRFLTILYSWPNLKKRKKERKPTLSGALSCFCTTKTGRDVS